MRKRVFAVLLSGALLLNGIVLPAAGSSFPEDTLIEEELSLADPLSAGEVIDESTPEESLDWAEEEELYIDEEELIEENSAEDLILEEEETITEDLYDPDSEEEIIESADAQNDTPDKGDILTDPEELSDEANSKWQAAAEFQRAARSLFSSDDLSSDELDQVGSSTQTKVHAAGLLRSYILKNGKLDEDGDRYFSASRNMGGVTATAEIYYLMDYEAFLFVLRMSTTVDGIQYVSEISMTLPESAAEGADIMYCMDPVSPSDPMVAAYAEISAPSAYTASTRLEFNVETLDTDLMDFEIQDLANDMLRAAFSYWDSLLMSRVKISMSSLRFDKYTQGHTHSYKEEIVRKATTSEEGLVRQVCSSCSDIKSNTTIPKIGSIRLNITRFTYNGQVLVPAVIVQDAGGKSISTAYFNTVFSDPKSSKPGTYTVKVTMKGRYSGSQTLSYVIDAKTASLPAQPVLYAGYNGTTGIAIQFYQVKDADYYQIFRKVSGGNWLLIKTISATDPGLVKSGTRLMYTDTAVKDKYSTVFTYSVAAKKGGKVSSFDPTGKVVNRLKPPTVTSIKQSGTDKAAISWSSVPCRAYELQYFDTSEKPYKYIKAGITTGTGRTVSGLQKGKTYGFRLRCYVLESTSPSSVMYSEYTIPKYLTIK